MSDEEVRYSCYDCKKLRVCGIQREMYIINDKYNNPIDDFYIVLAKNCKEFDVRE